MVAIDTAKQTILHKIQTVYLFLVLSAKEITKTFQDSMDFNRNRSGAYPN